MSPLPRSHKFGSWQCLWGCAGKGICVAFDLPDAGGFQAPISEAVATQAIELTLKEDLLEFKFYKQKNEDWHACHQNQVITPALATCPFLSSVYTLLWACEIPKRCPSILEKSRAALGRLTPLRSEDSSTTQVVLRFLLTAWLVSAWWCDMDIGGMCS